MVVSPTMPKTTSTLQLRKLIFLGILLSLRVVHILLTDHSSSKSMSETFCPLQCTFLSSGSLCEHRELLSIALKAKQIALYANHILVVQFGLTKIRRPFRPPQPYSENPLPSLWPIHTHDLLQSTPRNVCPPIFPQITILELHFTLELFHLLVALVATSQTRDSKCILRYPATHTSYTYSFAHQVCAVDLLAESWPIPTKAYQNSVSLDPCNRLDVVFEAKS